MVAWGTHNHESREQEQQHPQQEEAPERFIARMTLQLRMGDHAFFLVFFFALCRLSTFAIATVLTFLRTWDICTNARRRIAT